MHIYKKTSSSLCRNIHRPAGLPGRIAIALSTAILLLLCLDTPECAAQDNCGALNGNPAWTNGLQGLIDAIQNNDLQNAQMLSKQLADICPNAPTLNYLQGKVYEKLGDTSNALYYYQKASENTYTFAVDPGTAQKIWYARYEFEHPERSEQSVTSQNAELDALRAELDTLKAENHKLDELVQYHAPYKEAQYQTIQKLMWTGVGVAAGGLAFAGAGAALVALYEPNIISKHDDGKSAYTYKEDPTHSIGWALIGVGGGLLLGGVILAGIYGYKYKNFQTEDPDISFNLSPNGLSFKCIF